MTLVKPPARAPAAAGTFTRPSVKKKMVLKAPGRLKKKKSKRWEGKGKERLGKEGKDKRFK